MKTKKVKKIKVRFKKGIYTIKVPFEPDWGVWELIYKQFDKQLKKIEYPKKTKSINCVFVVNWDLDSGGTGYSLAEVEFNT